jgi:prevent-host-death family protein
MKWQVQEAKQKFSELLRRTVAEGPQVVTRHGKDVAIVVPATHYRKLVGRQRDFKSFLRSAPDFSALEIERPSQPARRVTLG